MLTPDDIKTRVTYHPPTVEATKLHTLVRVITEEALKVTDNHLPECREKSLAITKLEEYMFWANAAIARNHSKL